MKRKHAATCHYCERPTRFRTPTWDHVVPVSKGGPNNAWNKVTACVACNQLKADQVWDEHCDICRFAWHLFRYVDPAGWFLYTAVDSSWITDRRRMHA